MFSQQIMNQIDYKIVMNMINKSLNRNGPNGSISIGKHYANKYKAMINNMLCENEVNINILNQMLDIIDKDLYDVREDCNRRIRSVYTDSNDDMISMIADFLKSI